MDLATLAEVKGRLELADADVPRDAVIDAWRVAIQERVLALTGFLLPEDPYFSSIQKTEDQIDVQLGVSRLTQYRPIVPMSSDPARAITLQARSLASSTFNTILGDIRDAYRGRVMPLASELTPVFPPVGGLAPWLRWRQMIWPVVRFTYLVDPLGSPTNPAKPSLARAVVEWAAFAWAIKPLTGRIRSFSAEGISETYDNYQLTSAVPPIVVALLAPYTRGQASIIF